MRVCASPGRTKTGSRYVADDICVVRVSGPVFKRNGEFGDSVSWRLCITVTRIFQSGKLFLQSTVNVLLGRKRYLAARLVSWYLSSNATLFPQCDTSMSRSRWSTYVIGAVYSK